MTKMTCSKQHSLQPVELSQRSQTAVQIVSNLGDPIYHFCTSRLCGPTGWMALLLPKTGDIETNPGPTTQNKRVWIGDICSKKIHVRKQISISNNNNNNNIYLKSNIQCT